MYIRSRARIVCARLRAFSAAACDARHHEGRRFLLEPVHPWTTPDSDGCCFCGRMPPKRGPLWRGEQAQELRMYMDVHQANPCACLRTRSTRIVRRARHRGVFSLGDFLLGKQEKVTRSPQASGSLLLKTESKETALHEGFRRYDEQTQCPIQSAAQEKKQTRLSATNRGSKSPIRRRRPSTLRHSQGPRRARDRVCRRPI